MASTHTKTSSSDTLEPGTARFLLYLPEETTARLCGVLLGRQPDSDAQVSRRAPTPGLPQTWHVAVTRPLGEQWENDETLEAFGYLAEKCCGGRSLGYEYVGR